MIRGIDRIVNKRRKTMNDLSVIALVASLLALSIRNIKQHIKFEERIKILEDKVNGE